MQSLSMDVKIIRCREDSIFVVPEYHPWMSLIEPGRTVPLHWNARVPR